MPSTFLNTRYFNNNFYRNNIRKKSSDIDEIRTLANLNFKPNKLSLGYRYRSANMKKNRWKDLRSKNLHGRISFSAPVMRFES